MYKIALLGKANTGKNTTALLINSHLPGYGKLIAFADPIKEIVRTMFPKLSKHWLYGPSKFRNKIIEGAFDSEGNPLTIRKALLEIGTKVGRGYKDSMWLDVFNHRFEKQVKKKTGSVIVTDVRFRNEFDFLLDKGFIIIRINRESDTKINHISETNQDQIRDDELHYVLDNNKELFHLKETIEHQVFPLIEKIQG